MRMHFFGVRQWLMQHFEQKRLPTNTRYCWFHRHKPRELAVSYFINNVKERCCCCCWSLFSQHNDVRNDELHAHTFAHDDNDDDPTVVVREDVVLVSFAFRPSGRTLYIRIHICQFGMFVQNGKLRTRFNESKINTYTQSWTVILGSSSCVRSMPNSSSTTRQKQQQQHQSTTLGGTNHALGCHSATRSVHS